MNVSITLEQRFNQTPDGAVWTQAAFAYPFWQRYLEVFEKVEVAARVQNVTEAQTDWLRADGVGVTFVPLPYYVGPRQYLLNAGRVRSGIRRALDNAEAVIFRVPSPIAAAATPTLIQRGQPYAVEVVGDPYEVFAPGAVRHPLRPLFRWWFPRQLRRIVAGACAVSYVTDRTLQRRYPPTPEAFTTTYSSIELPDYAIISVSRILDREQKHFRLVTVGSLAQLYKGTDVLLQAVNRCVTIGLNVHLTVIGDGKHRAELENLSASLGLTERVCFLGQIPAGEAVRGQLDAADLFVLPSRTEGLPRAMIEAMARGLPCIGSTAGGIPELLPPEDLVVPGDTTALAQKIREVITQPDRMARMSARNLEKARLYAETVLRERRIAFYQHLKAETEAWLKTR
jgi:glycosyltransferase involved in cell wall biosynthesis